jgi:hypothetical protein
MHENFDRAEGIKLSSDRSFGMVFTFVFLVVGIWTIWGGKSAGWYFLAGAIIFFVVAMARPSLLGLLNTAWAKFGLLLGKAVNPVVLGFVFFLVVTPL